MYFNKPYDCLFATERETVFEAGRKAIGVYMNKNPILILNRFLPVRLFVPTDSSSEYTVYLYKLLGRVPLVLFSFTINIC